MIARPLAFPVFVLFLPAFLNHPLASVGCTPPADACEFELVLMADWRGTSPRPIACFGI
jgi:hypothetical protein